MKKTILFIMMLFLLVSTVSAGFMDYTEFPKNNATGAGTTEGKIVLPTYLGAVTVEDNKLHIVSAAGQSNGTRWTNNTLTSLGVFAKINSTINGWWTMRGGDSGGDDGTCGIQSQGGKINTYSPGSYTVNLWNITNTIPYVYGMTMDAGADKCNYSIFYTNGTLIRTLTQRSMETAIAKADNIHFVWAATWNATATSNAYVDDFYVCNGLNQSCYPFTTSDTTAPTYSGFSINASGWITNGTNIKWNISLADTTGLSSATFYNNRTKTNTTAYISGLTNYTYDIDIVSGNLGETFCGKYYFNDTLKNWGETDYLCYNISMTRTPIFYINSTSIYSATNRTDSDIQGYCYGTADEQNATISNYYYRWYHDKALNTSGQWVYQCFQGAGSNPNCEGFTIINNATYYGTGCFVGQPCSNFYDGDWTTGAYVATGTEVNITFNFTRANGSTSNSKLLYSAYLTTINYTIDVGKCWNETLRFRLYINNSIAHSIYCYNSSNDWERIHFSNVASTGYAYEAAMLWRNSSLNRTATINLSASASLVGNWTLSCLASNNSINSTWVNSSTLDITGFTAPTITINPTNFFSTGNNTLINNVSATSALLNVTFTDDYDLYAYEVTVVNSSLDTTYYVKNESLGGAASRNVQRILQLNNTGGKYYITINVTDSHTANEIGTYQVKKGGNYLEYDKQITITAFDAIGSSTIKNTDRYSFAFDYEKSIDVKTFLLESNKGLTYIPYSRYRGHFVDYANKKWIDFEGEEGDIAVTKIDGKTYMIEIANKGEKIELNSIGGLNSNSITYMYELVDIPSVSYVTPTTSTNTLENSISISISVTGNYQNYTTINLYNLTSLMNSTNLTYYGNGTYLYNITFFVNNASVHKFYVNATTVDKVNNTVVPKIGNISTLTYRELNNPTIFLNASITDDINYALNISGTIRCSHKWDTYLNYSFQINDKNMMIGYNQSNGTLITNVTQTNFSLNKLYGYCWSEYGSISETDYYGVVNVVFRKETTEEMVLDANMTMEIIGESVGGTKIISNISSGNFTIFFTISDVYAFRYYGHKTYSERFRYLTYDQNMTYNLTLYVLDNSTTSQITVVVYDQSGNFVEDAIVKLYRYNVVTNSYDLVEEGSTNFEGETKLNAEINSEFYKFLVYYNGELKKETSPTYIYDTTLNIYIDLSEGAGQNFETTEGISHDMEFKEDTLLFKATYDGTDSGLSLACLNVYATISNSRTLWNQSCTSSESSILYAGISNVSGRSYTAQIEVTIDGQQTVITELIYQFEDTGIPETGKSGLFLLLVFTMVAIGLGASFRGSVAIALAPLPLLIMSASHILNPAIDMGICIGLEVLALIIAGLVEAKRYG
jgi:hypothetical protein